MLKNRKRWVALILPLFVVGCGELIEDLHLPGRKAESESAAAEAKTVPVPPVPRSKPLALNANFDPDDLIGLAPARAVELLGEPSQRTQRFPAQIWRYEGQNCTLSLMFFQELVSEKYRTLSFEIQVDNKEDSDAQRRCIGSFFASKQAK